MKKLLAILLVCMLAIPLAACGGGKEGGNTGGDGGGKQGGTEGSIKGKTTDDYTILDVDAKDRTTDLEVTGIEVESKSYKRGEAVRTFLFWNGTPADDAWVGIVPADVPHGEELVNDDYDIDYVYIASYQPGEVIEFTGDYEPGEYTMRVHETDGGGPELAWCKFTITEGSGGGSGSSDVPPAGDGEEEYVNQGAVIRYGTDKFQEDTFFSGIEHIQGKDLWIHISIGGSSFAEERQDYADEYGDKENYSMTDLTVGGHEAFMVTFNQYGTTNAEVVINTDFIGDEFWSTVTIKGQSEDMSLDIANDPDFREVVDSFYYDGSRKYSF